MNDEHSSNVQEYTLPIPPHSIEAEQAVLGCMLKFPDTTLTPCIGSFTQEVFYDPRHRVLFGVLLELFSRGESVDLVTVGQRITGKHQLEEVGGSEYVRKLHDSVSTPANLNGYLDILRQKYPLRRMFELCARFIDEGSQPDVDAETLLDQWACAVARLNEVAIFPYTPSTMKKLMPDTVQVIERLIEYNPRGTRPLPGISTGFAELDQLTGGFYNGEVIVIAGGSFETSALAMNMVEHIVINQKLPVGIFSLKLTAQALALRLASSRARVDLQKIETGQLSNEDVSKLTAAAAELTDAPLFIDDTPSLTVLQLRARVQRMMMEHGIKVVVIDCLQLITPTMRESEDRPREITAVWNGVVRMAKDLRVPIVVLSRPHSQIESPDGKSQLSDLQESGIMGTGAGWVALLRKLGNENENSDAVTGSLRVDLLVACERRGVVGKVPLSFLPGYGRFESVTNANSQSPLG